MNIFYLMNFISHRLHTWVRRFDNAGILLTEFCGRQGFHDSLTIKSEILSAFLRDTPRQMPQLAADGNRVFYASVRAFDSLFVIGPLRLPANTSLKKSIPLQNTDPLRLYAVNEMGVPIVCEYLLLICNLEQETSLTQEEIIYENCVDQNAEDKVQKSFSDTLFYHQEAGDKHNPYDQEVREQSAIKNGDMDQLRKSIAEDFSGSYGVLAKDRLRSVKNLCIVVVALASRAAIAGGVLPEVAFTLSDSYICRIEELSNTETLLHLARQAEYQYTGMVHDILEQKKMIHRKKENNPHIIKCKDYISHHLHEKIYIRSIASAVGLNPNYLAELFKECEGTSIQDFISREKINRAKNLLIYSDYSYIEIAVYLGFSSQSHLGTQFKAITGYTPGQYRAKYGVKQFQSPFV